VPEEELLNVVEVHSVTGESVECEGHVGSWKQSELALDSYGLTWYSLSITLGGK
jgi:hypothetical protein